MNTEADLASRVFQDQTEWQLNPSIYKYIVNSLFKPDIGLFASRLNYQMKPYVSWQPDPGACAIDAFTRLERISILCLSTFFFAGQSHTENRARPSNRHFGHSQLEHPAMVSKSSETTTSTAITFAIPERHPNTALQARSLASTGTQATADGMQFIRQAIQGIGISQEATEIVMSSWRKATQKQYKGYIERWLKFCSENGFNSSSPQIREVIDYLVMLFESGLGYSCVNTARSALSSVLCKVVTLSEVIPWW